MNKTQILKFLKKDSENLILGYLLRHKSIPIISCWKIDDIHVSFFCPDCKKIHNHGCGNGFNGRYGNGHRCAHCHNSESRFGMSGYYLCCQGDLTEVEDGG